MMRRRRRPIARAAVIGGGAYMAGKSRANSQAAEQDQNAQIAQLQAEQAAMQQPQAAAAPAADPQTAELERLAGLHSSGVLTDEEFTAAKAKVLGI
jgi:multidrug resistance efflux pump